MAYLMGIDLGTSSLKVIVIDAEGNLKAQAARSHKFDSPEIGFAEQDVTVWWEACCAAVRQAIDLLGAPAEEIKAVSFSGQMHGAVLLDSELRPVRPAILHCDARSAQQVAHMERVLGADLIQRVVLNPIYTGFLLPSLLWVREVEPHNYRRTRYAILPKDYLKLKLSDRITSDYSDASATLAFDIKQGSWSREILQRLDVPEEILPECYATTEPIGRVTRAAAEATGLAVGTLVVNGGGDQIMQAIGAGAVNPGMATVNIGSSGQVCFQCDRPIANPRLNTNTFCGFSKERWITMGATMSAGLSLAWFNSLFPHTDYEELNREVAKIRPGSGGLVFLPYINGERTPHVNPNLRGMFVGMNPETDRYQLARAVMEGVAFSLRECLEVCWDLGLTTSELIASGGGARSAPWLQIQADVYNLPLRVSAVEEQAGLGAAIAAGVGAGIFKSINEGCQAAVKYKEEMYLPSKVNHELYTEYYQLFKEAFSATRGVMERAAQLGRATGVYY